MTRPAAAAAPRILTPTVNAEPVRPPIDEATDCPEPPELEPPEPPEPPALPPAMAWASAMRVAREPPEDRS
jgi:hypothetical protein